MGICCSNHDPKSDDALAFTNDDTVLPGEKKSILPQLYNSKLQDNAPLLNTTDMKMVTMTDSSDGSFDEAEINKMIAEAEEESSNE